MKKYFTLIFVLILVTCAGLGFYFLYYKDNSDKKRDVAELESYYSSYLDLTRILVNASSESSSAQLTELSNLKREISKSDFRSDCGKLASKKIQWIISRTVDAYSYGASQELMGMADNLVKLKEAKTEYESLIKTCIAASS